MSGENSESSGTFHDVPGLAKWGSQLRRMPSGGTISPTGFTDLNTNSSKDIRQIAHDLGLDQEQFSVAYSVDPEAMQVAARPVANGTLGSSPTRIRKGENPTVSLHLSNVFEAFPALRVEGRRQIAVNQGLDAKGRPCLMLSLRSALAKPKISRKKAEPTKAGTTKDAKATTTGTEQVAATETKKS